MRIRRRCGWPSKVIPNMSHTSRSYQFAAGQISAMVLSESAGSTQRNLEPDVVIAIKREQMVEDREIARRPTVRSRRTRSSTALRSYSIL